MQQKQKAVVIQQKATAAGIATIESTSVPAGGDGNSVAAAASAAAASSGNGGSSAAASAAASAASQGSNHYLEMDCEDVIYPHTLTRMSGWPCNYIQAQLYTRTCVSTHETKGPDKFYAISLLASPLHSIS